MSNFSFTFNSRESYLEYRADWKNRYLQISQNIRNARAGFKDAQRHLPYSEILTSLLNYEQRKGDARLALEELSEAKFEAERQYMARKK